jgi:HTH-type transcriptional regulator/antitoxin HigA
MEIRPIKSEADYFATLAEVERLFDATPDTPEGDRLEVLTTLLEAYEKNHYSIPSPDPVETLTYWMESKGITRKDMEPLVGSRARLSEIFNHRRGLTLTMIRNLHNKLGIPVEALIQPVQLRRA